MNSRNKMIKDILKYQDKYKNKKELLCKNNGEIIAEWETIRYLVEADEELEKDNDKIRYEEFECMKLNN